MAHFWDCNCHRTKHYLIYAALEQFYRQDTKREAIVLLNSSSKWPNVECNVFLSFSNYRNCSAVKINSMRDQHGTLLQSPGLDEEPQVRLCTWNAQRSSWDGPFQIVPAWLRESSSARTAVAFVQENQAGRGFWRFSVKNRLLKSKHEMLFHL